MLEKVVKCYFVPLLRLSYIYWLIHFKNGNGRKINIGKTYRRKMKVETEEKIAIMKETGNDYITRWEVILFL